MDDIRPVRWLVLAGTSAWRDQPSEFMESRKEADAMVGYVRARGRQSRRCLYAADGLLLDDRVRCLVVVKTLG
jgi:hypothetical protein